MRPAMVRWTISARVPWESELASNDSLPQCAPTVLDTQHMSMAKLGMTCSPNVEDSLSPRQRDCKL